MRPLEPYRVDNPIAVEYAANVQFCEFSSTNISSVFADKLLKLFQVDGVKPVTLFCFDDDETNFRLANELNDALKDFHAVNLNPSSSSENDYAQQAGQPVGCNS